jgi:HAD superfamily hydrolase (TIGR01509 family)
MKNDKKCSAVIFDLDGLILDTESIARIAWKQAAADFGFVLDDDLYQKLIGLVTPDIGEVLRDAFGATFCAEEAIQRAYGHFDEYIEKNGIEIKPGFFEVIELLDKAGIPRAIATSSSKAFAGKKFAASGLVGKFSVVVCGDEVQNGKPAPDIFLAAAKKLGVTPQRCLVFEDSDNGIKAAHRAGMTIILIPDLKQPSKEIARLAYKVCSSLLEARSLLRTIIDGANR